MARKARGERLRLRLMGIRLSGLHEGSGGEREGTLHAFFQKAATDGGKTSGPTHDTQTRAVKATPGEGEKPSADGEQASTDEPRRKRGPLDRLWKGQHATEPRPVHVDAPAKEKAAKKAAETPAASTLAGAGNGDVEELVSCPICYTFKLPAGNNAALNEHIDLCLNRGAVQQLAGKHLSENTGERPSKTARRQTHDVDQCQRPGTLRNFFSSS